MIRMGFYLSIGFLFVSFFKSIGAPGIALAEISISVEAILLLIWLNRRLDRKLAVWSALYRGISAALLGGVVAYVAATFLPGASIITALIGMAIGGLVALPIIIPDLRMLFQL